MEPNGRGRKACCGRAGCRSLGRESALERGVQDFPREYDYNDELQRFRHAGKVWLDAERTAKDVLLEDVAQQLVDCGATLLPTRVVYEANRDILRAQSLPWHDRLMEEVARMVAGSKSGVEPSVVERPFVTDVPSAGGGGGGG